MTRQWHHALPWLCLVILAGFTAARADMMADSPVTFPQKGALPAKYPPDVKVQSEPAEEIHCAYLDMTTPWAQYIRSSKVHPHRFYRDVVHANEYGEQILAKTMMAFWTASDGRPLEARVGIKP